MARAINLKAMSTRELNGKIASMPEPIPLEYRTEPMPKSSWPVAIYISALVWALLSLRLNTALSSVYNEGSGAALRTQMALLLGAAGRLGWARTRREQGRGWIFYVALLAVAPLLWPLIAPPLDRLGVKIWGGPWIP